MSQDGGESDEEDGLAGIEAASDDQDMLPGEDVDLGEAGVLMEEGEASGEDEESFDLDEEIAAEEDDVEGVDTESEEY